MIDVISGGRVISGFVRGIGCEYYSLSLDPTVSRRRFYEAHDLIVKAWTEPGPFAWDGEHYQFRLRQRLAAAAPEAAPADLLPVARVERDDRLGRRAASCSSPRSRRWS